ncbi:helix-turn-helix transcriptional regulator [Roseovarius nanhaiticus]|uniref:Regulatory protein, luxR family n=1 Tax=Roseovarius nanhaiticus TaxID=573024 RepID=A0A1N7H464_9RHOB|nr:helix-turn-helix transcriptional regulator [Roseovarius nanhaiticus]SEL13743.1 regulatory protein, luxR family [Roseovarius nanhaiticus]SIS19647.1 regulatory protein, luxR family [Roseovarius nanhaiticus]
MSRIWAVGLLAVGAIATLKTYVVVHFTTLSLFSDLAMISGLFVLFYGLTGAVAYFSFTQLRAYLERQRKEKLSPGAGEPVAKETVILRNAPDWGLSQAEADVAIFVAKGFSNNEIAEMRGCAIATVKSQLGRIYQKSGLESRYQLIAFVTDEVCSMATEQRSDKKQVMTQDALPLAGRARSAA